MKKLFPLLCAASLMAVNTASATIFTVQVGNFQFTPSSIPNVHVGDTVQWVWNNGFHTTTSLNIPTGAATWDEPMTATKTFNYKVTVPGAYTYKCTPHESMGMTASFTAQAASGVGTANAVALFRMFPNPAAGNIRLELRDAAPVTITVTDALGRTVRSGNYTGGKTIDIATTGFANGTYIVRAVVAGKEAYAQSFEVAR